MGNKRNLVYAKNINGLGSGILDISKTPPEIFCYSNPFVSEEILNLLQKKTQSKQGINVSRGLFF